MLIRYVLAIIAMIAIGSVHAAEFDGEAAQRGIQRLNQPNLPPITTPPVPESEAAKSGQTVEVKSSQFVGAQLLPEAVLQAEVQGYIGKSLDFEGLNRVARKISEFYRTNGRLAKVYLPPQDIQNGLVTIEINEAKLGELRVEPAPQARLNPKRPERMLKRAQQPGAPLNQAALERSMLLINDMPGVAANATLSAGQSSGETDVTVNLQDRPMVEANVWADNFGNTFLGKARLNGQVNFNNLTGETDKIGVQAMVSKHVEFLQGEFDYPLNDLGTRFRLGGSVSNFQNDRQNLDVRSDGYSYHAGLMHPLIRTRYYILALRGAYEEMDFNHDVLGIEISDKVYRALSMALEGDRSDDWGWGGTFWGGLAIKVGNLDLSGNRDDLAADKLSARTDGRYHKLNLYLGRQQILGKKTTATALFSAQLADKNLGAFEKFSLGGPAGLRGYAVGEAAADQGWMLNLEGRYAVTPQFSASLLADAGGVCLNKNTWAGWDAGNPKLKNCYQLGSVGLGASFTHKNFDARMTYGRQISSNRGLDSQGKDAEGERRKHQFWLQLSTKF